MKLRAAALFLLLLTMLAPPSLLGPAQAQAPSGLTIDFEEFEFFDVPDGSNWDFALGGAGCSAYVVDSNSTHGMVLQIKGTSCAFNFNVPGGDYADFTFDAYAVGTSGPSVTVGLTEFDQPSSSCVSGSTNDHMDILLGAPWTSPNLLKIGGNYDGDSIAETDFQDETFAVNNWETQGVAASFDEYNGGTQWNITGYDYDAPDLVQKTGPFNIADPAPLDSFCGFFSATQGTWWLDNIQFGGGAATGPPAFTDVDSVSVTQLTGFDIDDLGQWIITRQANQGSDGFDLVAIYDGQNLVQGGTTDTGCNRDQGVASLPTAVSYLWCDPLDAGDQNVKEIHVKSPSLNTPDWPGQCSAYCRDEIPIGELEGNQALYREVDDVKAFPFDFSASFSQNQLDRTYMAWAFGDNSGRAGVVTLTQINNADDNSDFDAVTVDSSSIPQVDQICTTGVTPYADGTASDYLIAGTQNSVTRVFDVTFTKDTIGVQPLVLPTMLVDVSPKTGGSAPTTANQALGVDCGQLPRYVVATALNKVVVVDYSGTQSSVLWSTDATVEGRGVTMSRDGLFVAWLDDDGSGNGNGTVYIANSTTGTVVGTIDVPQDPDGPAGTDFQDIAMDFNAQNLWLAFGDRIYRYEVFPATTGDPVGAGSLGAGSFGSEQGSTVGEGQFGTIIDTAAAASGLSPSLTGGLFTFLLVALDVGILAGAAFAATRHPGLTVGAAFGGAVLGLGMSYSFGIAQPWAVTLIVVILVAAAVLAVVFSRR